MGTDIFTELGAYGADGIEHGAGILKDHGEFLPPQRFPLPGCKPLQLLAFKRDRSFGHGSSRRQKPQNRADGGGLAAAALTYQDYDLSLLHGKREILQCQALSISNRQPIDLKHCCFSPQRVQYHW